MATNQAIFDSTCTMTLEAKEFALKIFPTLSSEYLGFKLDELKFYLSEDLDINADEAARKVGYTNLQDFLESSEMHSWVRVADVQNDRGRVSRIYRAKPIDVYLPIYLEQKKAYEEMIKRGPCHGH